MANRPDAHADTDPIGDAGMESFEKLKQIVTEAEDDIAKAEGGNKAAGTRARKSLQDVRNLAQEIRKEILALRDQGN